MKKTVFTIIVTALVTDTLVTRVHNQQIKRRNLERAASRKKEDSLFAIKRASNLVGRKAAQCAYSTPQEMIEDYEFELIVGHL